MLWKYLTTILVSVLPFLFSLNGDFVFDDSEAIVNNKDVVSDGLYDLFYHDFWGTDIQSNLSHKSYRPLTIMSFRLNHVLSGSTLNAFHFKVTNLICHAICCIVLLYVYETIAKRFCRHIRDKSDISFLATILFAVHPIHTEAICGIVGRADILSAITFFMSFLLYEKSIHARYFMFIYLLSSVLFAGVAMLFKENGITVLGFCIIYELMTNFTYTRNDSIQKSHLVWHNNRNFWKRLTVVILSGILFLYGRWIIMGATKPQFKPTNNPAAFSSNVYTKVATFNYIYFLNFLLLVWPEWLCYDWSMGCITLIENLMDYRIVTVVLIYVYGSLYMKAILNKNSPRLLIVALSLLVIPYLPASNILFPVGFVIAERILYLPSTGYCLCISIGFNKLNGKTNSNVYKRLIKLAFIYIIFIYSLKSYQRSFDWQNENNLFIRGYSVCPLNAKVRYNIAKVADAQQNTSWALFEYKEAIRLYPDYYQAMNNLANLLKNQKQYQEAEYYLRKAISLKEDFPAAWMNLGIVLANTKRYNESEVAYIKALRYRRNYPDCLYNLGNLYLELNNTNAASDSWFAAINLNPKHAYAWTNLIVMLDNTGQRIKALDLIPRALAELPNAPSLIFSVANIYGKIDRFEEAEIHFKRAIELFDHKVQAIHFANIGVLYHRWKKYDLAKQMYKRALEIDPNFKSAKKNLAQLHK